MQFFRRAFSRKVEECQCLNLTSGRGVWLSAIKDLVYELQGSVEVGELQDEGFELVLQFTKESALAQVETLQQKAS